MTELPSSDLIFQPGQLYSIKRIFQTGDSEKVNSQLKYLLENDLLIPELIPSLLNARQRVYILLDLLAKAVVKTESSVLFDAAEASFCMEHELGIVFSVIRRVKLEKRLCDFFDSGCRDPSPYGLFDTTLNALVNFGGELSAEALDSILYELAPRENVAKLVLKSDAEIFDSIDAAATRLNHGLVINRASKIREKRQFLQARVNNRDNLPFRSIAKSDAGACLERAEQHTKDGEEQRCMKRPRTAGNCFRSAGEAYLKAVFLVHLKEQKIPVNLDELINRLSSINILNDPVKADCAVLKAWGNYVSHDQMVSSEKTEEIRMQGCRDALLSIKQWACAEVARSGN